MVCEHAASRKRSTPSSQYGDENNTRKSSNRRGRRPRYSHADIATLLTVHVQTDRQIVRQTDRKINRQTDRQIDRQIDRHTDRQTDRQTNRQTGGQLENR